MAPPYVKKCPPNSKLPFADINSLGRSPKDPLLPVTQSSNKQLATGPSRSRLGPANYSFHIKLLLILVAIPIYLLASGGLSKLGQFANRDSHPSPAPAEESHSDAFASVLGPVVAANFPDPAIIHFEGTSYAFATNNRGIGPAMRHLQVATSTDNETWTLMADLDALPYLGAWETGARVWAPDVVRVADGTFVLYYTDEPTWSPSHHCLGAATSESITGPYKPLDTPFACPDLESMGGAIDPDGFLDPSTGKRYVTYKVDGNSIGHGGLCVNSVPPIVPTPILLQEVGPDGITLIGDPVQLLDRIDEDGPLIEAPTLYRSDEGIYFLFYSSNCFVTPMYDTTYATAPAITGPYTRAERPLLITGDGPNLVGPGGMDIVEGGNMIVFHGHITESNVHGLIRGMYIATATFDGVTVSLA